MAVRTTLEFDLRRSLSQVQTLESAIDELREPVVIPLDIKGNATQDIREIGQRLEDIEQGAAEVTRELVGMELAIGNAVTDFSRLASELNISEQEARDLSREILEARNASERTSDAAREVARTMGLSEDEAARFATEIGKAQGRMAGLDSEARQTAGSVDRVGGGVDRLRSGLGRLVLAAGAFIGIRELAQFAASSITAFSNLQESTSKANVVFGDFSDTVLTFVDDAPTKLGSTSAAALEMASSFGNLFLSVGLGQETAAGRTTTLTQLGSDLASFNNISVDEALEKLRSGLVGQAEPLRTVGVLLSEAAVNAKGLELGLGGASGKLSEAEKVQARYAIILEQTVTAQGDFARTSDGIANSSRTAAALFGELKTTIGEALAPAFAALLDQVPAIIEGFERMAPAIAASALALADFFTPKPGQADFMDFVSLLVDLPRGFGLVANAGKSVAIELEAANRAVGALFTLNPGQFIKAIQDIDREMTDFHQNTLETTSMQGFIDSLREGGDAASVLANYLAHVGREGKLDPAFVKNLIAIGGLDFRTGQAGITALLGRAKELGLEADDISALNYALAAMREEMDTGGRANADYLATVAAMRDEFETAAPAVLSQIDVLTLLAAEADIAGVSLETLLTNAADFPELAELIGSLEPGTADLAIASGRLAAFAASFETTEIRVSDAIDELGNLPNKLKITVGEFLDNLKISAADEAKFQTNLLKLFEIAPNLAIKLRDQGPASRDLVKGFLADATSAQNAEDVLTGNAEEITGIFVDSVTEFIKNSDLSPAGIIALEDFMEGFGNTTVAETGIAALQRIIQAELARLKFGLNAEQVYWYGVVGGGPGGVGGGPVIGGGVTINTTINNPTTTDLPTNTAQVIQSQTAVAAQLQQISGPQ